MSPTRHAHALRRIALTAAVLLGWSGAAPALLITQDAGSITSARRGTLTVVLDPLEVAHADQGATPEFLRLLNSEFDGRNADGTLNPAVDWTFTPGPTFNGTATVQQYDAYIGSDAVGAIFDLLLDGPGTGENLYWVQFVETNFPRVVGLNPTVDPPNTGRNPPGDDNQPFYFTTGSFDRSGNGAIEGSEDEMANGFLWNGALVSHPGTPFRTLVNPSALVDLVFLDAPSRPLRSGIDWDAWLYVASWDGVHGSEVVIHDGVHWGFRTVPEPGVAALLVVALASLGAVRSATRSVMSTASA
ncbi:MAG: hypothetical protein RLW61_15875 [Gammaproteobacteria bacterium]